MVEVASLHALEGVSTTWSCCAPRSKPRPLRLARCGSCTEIRSLACRSRPRGDASPPSMKPARCRRRSATISALRGRSSTAHHSTPARATSTEGSRPRDEERLASIVLVAIVPTVVSFLAVDLAENRSDRFRIACARMLRDDLAEESDGILRRTIVRVELRRVQEKGAGGASLEAVPHDQLFPRRRCDLDRDAGLHRLVGAARTVFVADARHEPTRGAESE